MSRWRAKHHNIPLTPAKKLVVTFRRFRTFRKKRNKSLRLTLYFSVFSIKEIAIHIEKQPRRRRMRKAARQGFGDALKHSKVLPVILVLIGLSGTTYFGLHMKKPQALQPVKTFAPPVPSLAYAATEVKKGMSRSEPTHIHIASVEIDYDIMAVGRQADGTMETPPLFESITGWYKYSPTPGEIGPAIIVGHIDTYKGPSVFWRLRDLQAGDAIEITRADKSTAKFKVDALKEFDQENFPTAEVYGNINYAGLRLITCGGTFNSATGHYSANTVVYASAI